MGVNSLPKTVTGQRRSCDLNPGPSAPESSTLTTRLPSHPMEHKYLDTRHPNPIGTAADRVAVARRRTARVIISIFVEKVCPGCANPRIEDG